MFVVASMLLLLLDLHPLDPARVREHLEYDVSELPCVLRVSAEVDAGSGGAVWAPHRGGAVEDASHETGPGKGGEEHSA